MIPPHMTTFDPDGACELIQGIDFHKQKFAKGTDYVFKNFDVFLLRDAMQARPRHAVSVCLYVCPSVRPSRSWILSK